VVEQMTAKKVSKLVQRSVETDRPNIGRVEVAFSNEGAHSSLCQWQVGALVPSCRVPAR